MLDNKTFHALMVLQTKGPLTSKEFSKEMYPDDTKSNGKSIVSKAHYLLSSLREKGFVKQYRKEYRAGWKALHYKITQKGKNALDNDGQEILDEAMEQHIKALEEQI